MRGALVRGLIGSVLVAAGEWCYARLPHGTWADHLPLIGPGGAARTHPHVGVVLAFAGLVMLTWGWWLLRRQVRGRADGLARVRWTTAAWAAPLLLAPPSFSGDGWSYVATGALAGRGLSPYVATASDLPLSLASGVSPMWRGTPSPYGPLPLAWGGLASQVTQDPWLLLLCYRLLAIGGVLLVAWATPRLARRCGVDPVGASALVLASPLMLVHGIGGLHNDVVVAGMLMAALVGTRRDHWWWGAVLVGAAAAVKVPGGLGAVGVVLLSLGPAARWGDRLRRTAQVGVVSVGTLLGLGWLTGLGTGWIGALAIPDREHTPLALTSQLGVLARRTLLGTGSAGERLVLRLHPEALVKDVGLVLLVVLVLWVLLVRPAGKDQRALTGTGVVLLATLVLGPAVHYWYFLWCVPVLACVRLPGPARAALVALVATLGLAAVGEVSLGLRWVWEPAVLAVVLAPLVVGLWALRQPAPPPGVGRPAGDVGAPGRQ